MPNLSPSFPLGGGRGPRVYILTAGTYTHMCKYLLEYPICPRTYRYLVMQVLEWGFFFFFFFFSFYFIYSIVAYTSVAQHGSPEQDLNCLVRGVIIKKRRSSKYINATCVRQTMLTCIYIYFTGGTRHLAGPPLQPWYCTENLQN